MLGELLIAGGIAIAGGLAAKGAKLHRRWRNRRLRSQARSWSELAPRIGGEFRMVDVTQYRQIGQRRGGIVTQPVGTISLPVLEVAMNGIPVTARVRYAPRTGYRTYIEAEFALGIGPAFRLNPRSTPLDVRSDSIEDWYEIEVGDVFLIMATMERVPVDDMLIDSNGEAISAVRYGFEQDPLVLERGIALVAGIATSDAFGLRVLRAVRDAEWIDRDDATEFPVIEVAVPERVRIGPEKAGNTVVTAFRLEVGRAVEFEVELGPGGALPDETQDAVPRGALSRLEGLGAARCSCSDGQLHYAWTFIGTDADRVLATARALAALARALSGSVYR